MEHHLFPAVCFVHYPAIAAIVKDECGKQGVPYATYPSLPTILGRFIAFMAKAGAAEQRPMARAERFWVSPAASVSSVLGGWVASGGPR